MENNGFEELYKKDVPSTRSGLFYNLYSYPTKISAEVVAVYIATHTRVGDTVLDVFGGSGTTALGARLCECPNEKMIDLAKKMNLLPEWGPRKVIIYEIGKYGSFATKTMMNEPDADEFEQVGAEFLKEAKKRVESFYQIRDDEGKQGIIRHVIWSDVVKCSHCDREVSYYDAAVKYHPFSINKSGKCPWCGHDIDLEKAIHVTEEKWDSLLKMNILQRKRIPKKIYGVTNKRKWCRMATKEDIELFNTIGLEVGSEARRIEWGDLYRSGYHQGITHLHHFYTKRNYNVMDELWQMAEEYEEKIANALKLVLLSYNASHATLMTRVVAKKNSKDFVLTGAQSGVLYISGLPVEKNIILGIERKIKSFVEAFRFLNKCKGKAIVWNDSSLNMDHIRDGSIDYIFTDPPFGDYIPYAEVNQINELWLEDITDKKSEVIISSAQKKSLFHYQNMLSKVFCEMNRVLKDEGKATVVFHSSKADVWNVVCSAMEQAGMEIKMTSILNKVQGSFKQVVESNTVKGDPVMLLKKGRRQKGEKILFESFVMSNIMEGDLDERHIYSEYISKCLSENNEIEMDAKEAYDIIRRMVGNVS